MLSLCANVAVAEDITQDTFLKAIKNIRSFDEKKDIKAWLFTIARNTYFTQHNREKIYADGEIVSNEVKDNSNNILDDSRSFTDLSTDTTYRIGIFNTEYFEINIRASD